MSIIDDYLLQRKSHLTWKCNRGDPWNISMLRCLFKNEIHVVEYDICCCHHGLMTSERHYYVWKHSPRGCASGSITLLLTRKHIHSAKNKIKKMTDDPNTTFIQSYCKAFLHQVIHSSWVCSFLFPSFSSSVWCLPAKEKCSWDIWGFPVRDFGGSVTQVF